MKFWLFLFYSVIITSKAYSQAQCVDLFKIPGNFRPYRLSLENGDQKITGIRFGSLKYISDAGVVLLLKDIREILKTDPDIKILVESSGNDHFKRWYARLPGHLQKRVQDISLNLEDIWARDYSKPIDSDSPSILLPSFRYVEEILRHQSGTTELQRLLGRNDFLNTMKEYTRYGVKVEQTALPFEGGDIVVGARHLFIGAQVIRNASHLFKISEQEAVKLYEKVFRKRVFVLKRQNSPSLQPIEYHADLVLSVVRSKESGKEVILLNSPRLLMEMAIEKDIPSFSINMGLDFISTISHFANSRIDSKYVEVDDSISLMQQHIRTQALVEDLRQMENLKKKLEDEGYEVIEVPGFKLYVNLPVNSILKFINYTNVVVGKDIALVPIYGVRELDSYVIQIFTDLGYRVVPMTVARETLKISGGPRCSCEVFYESNVASTP